jgi:hypothetical protein
VEQEIGSPVLAVKRYLSRKIPESQEIDVEGKVTALLKSSVG